jgi:hypothetical protein
MTQISSIKSCAGADTAEKTGPKKSKMPPFGGDGTIYFSHRDVNKTEDLAGAAERPLRRDIFTTAYVAEMTLWNSKLGKTRKSIPDDSSDSCHGVSLTLG